MINDQKRLATREWLLILSLAVIVEYLILDVVLRYGGSSEVINYVSFAGTIVSIILAVLAIVYSYYQNFSQQRDSSNIASQIELLQSTVSDVRVSKEDFIAELQRINVISDKLDESIKIVTESRGHVSNIRSEIQSVVSALEKVNIEKFNISSIGRAEPNQTDLTPDQIKKIFIEINNPLAFVMLYAIMRSVKEKLDDIDRFDKYFWEPSKADVDEELYQFYLGLYMGYVKILGATGLLQITDDSIQFHDELSTLLTKVVEKGKYFDHTEWHKTISRINAI